MKPQLVYCYDAYCGWCYGFSPVIKKIIEEFNTVMDSEAYSGGMILPDKPVHINATAGYISNAYKRVEELTGVKFGEDYLWHIFNPDKSDWYPSSLKPAIALCVFKTYYPKRSVEFSTDLKYSLHYEGRDLTDDEAYRHLLVKYEIDPDAFYSKLKSKEFTEAARYEFAIVKQLQVTGYPTVFIRVKESAFHKVAEGYTPYEILKDRIVSVLSSV